MGGAKKHGETNFTLEAPVTYTFTDADNSITKGTSGFEITDEAFFLMTWAKDPAPKMLATSPVAPTRSAGTHAGEIAPQAWTYERTFFPRLGGQPTFRSFVWMQGHNYVNLQDPARAADAAPRHRVGGQGAGGRAHDLRRRRRPQGSAVRRCSKTRTRLRPLRQATRRLVRGIVRADDYLHATPARAQRALPLRIRSQIQAMLPAQGRGQGRQGLGRGRRGGRSGNA